MSSEYDSPVGGMGNSQRTKGITVVKPIVYGNIR